MGRACEGRPPWPLLRVHGPPGASSSKREGPVHALEKGPPPNCFLKLPPNFFVGLRGYSLLTSGNLIR